MKTFSIAAALAVLAAPAFADGHASGDAAAGEEQFNRQCVACHVVQNEDGEVLAGRNAQVGPNLYGIMGRAAGAEEGFKYGESLAQAGENGLVWDEEQMIAYLADPKKYLRTYLDDKKAKSKMAFKLKKEDQRAAVAAYLLTVSE